MDSLCKAFPYVGIIQIRFVQWESNTYRISAAIFGAFEFVVLDLRQQACVLRIQKQPNISRRTVQSSFCGVDFHSGAELAVGNTLCITKGDDKAWVKINLQKPAWVRFPLDMGRRSHLPLSP